MAGTQTYVIGICGTGTGALAGLLRQAGHAVSGSDALVYPPMSDKLREWGIAVHDGYAEANLAACHQRGLDHLVVGNVVRRDNPEASYARVHNLPTLSMPQAIATFGIGARHSVVVAGTHGKTTTTALLAHVLVQAGCDPGFLVGGALVGYRESFHLGQGAHFVVEGDEYDTAYFDKGPKFLHYRGKTVVITSLEYDHADIYPNVEAIEAAFQKLIAQVPSDGHLVIWGGAHRAVALARQHARCPVTLYGEAGAAGEAAGEVSAEAVAGAAAHAAERTWARQVQATDVTLGPPGVAFTAATPTRFTAPLWGNFGVHNALAAIVVARGLGLADAAIAAGLASFAGVRRRLEVRAEVAGVTVVDDFGHHPTAVRATLAAARTRWPNRRLWAVFEPRSATSRRNVFEQAYVEALAMADCTIVAHHPRLDEVAEAERFSPARVAQALAPRQAHAVDLADAAAIATYVAAHARAGDVVLVLSNGAFDGVVDKLTAALAAPSKAN